ncbi:hypothetical protein DYB32_008527 [Aphanomyces invadans]|uniref:DDE-1 domain-containing protein n=1 Tax=Aphanomyces invadans TaxID=157072 RepID=A0A418AL32_9STRA|nr:hypothetical protein DYB32_008527 [Aphanomyces invadans]
MWDRGSIDEGFAVGVRAKLIQRPTTCKKSQVFLAETRDEFACEFHREYRAYGKECTYNVDETGIYYDMPPNYIWAKRGGSSKISAGEKHSMRMTAVLTARADDEKLPIMFIMKGQRTYEQLMALHQQQQMQANAQMELNQRLMAELALQRDQQNQLMAQLEAQRRTTENHDQGLLASASSSILQAEALEDMRRRTSARWHAFTATPAPQTVQTPATVGVHIVYGFQEVPKAPTFNGSTKLKMDGSIISAESRVSKLVSDIEAALVRLNMEGFAETEPKLTVDSLMAAITPLAVQKRVRELM